jgi:hypothetical protein
MLNIHGYKGNANRNHLKIDLIPVRMVIKSQETTNVGKDVRKKEPSYIVGGNVN